MELGNTGQLNSKQVTLRLKNKTAHKLVLFIIYPKVKIFNTVIYTYTQFML